MALCKAQLVATASMAVVVGALLPATATPNNRLVGDMEGWDLGVNYDNWVRANDGIPVGDILMFVYDPVFHNVVQVLDEDSYNRCVMTNSTLKWNSGNDTLYLGAAGKYFFFCGMGDHCSRGMKLAITAI